jgi:hypothetical protein
VSSYGESGRGGAGTWDMAEVDFDVARRLLSSIVFKNISMGGSKSALGPGYRSTYFGTPLELA